MFLNTVHSEWTKLRTTKSFWWTTALIFLITTGWTLLNSLNAGEAVLGISPLQERSLGSIILLMGMPIIMIQASMVVTTEYRYKTQSQTFMANPQRWTVACAKLLLYGVIAAIIAFLGLVYIFVLADVTANESAAEAFQPFASEDGKYMLWAFPLAAFGLVAFVQGLGMLLRQTAGTVAICLILYLGLENIVRVLPLVGDKVIHFMPFTAFQNWAVNYVDENAPWSSVGFEALVFFGWAAVLWIVGVIVLEKRDA
ncbi:ABC transporter permease [Corynebacterium sp. HMSC066C02]|uniref:ABC transporter permease n=1 Tax=Corynebacterium sp. HMSC066C02 TaxID=1739500 RepID=UPI0008A5C75E|nr:ABC transporter permease [Corynebacterium sp. HMSC066C02]OFP21532.1 ABC transporter permease [Corynebacterium sp. HMSC066C02]